MSIIMPACPTDDNSELPITLVAEEWLHKNDIISKTGRLKKKLTGIELARLLAMFKSNDERYLNYKSKFA